MLSKQAYTETYYLISEMSETLRSKIPNEIIETIKENMDKTYKFNSENKNLEEIKLLPDTEKLLSVIYTDYIANEEESKIIKAKEKSFQEAKIPKIEIKEMFQENKKQFQEETKTLLEIKKEKWHIKIFKLIKRFFKRKK